MERLTDIDALAKEFDEKCSNECGCCEYAVTKIVLVGQTKCRIFERCGLIANAPTVDAIPVEWLENRLNTLCFEAMGAGALYGDRIGELAKSINEVMKLWQKEQEAQDG